MEKIDYFITILILILCLSLVALGATLILDNNSSLPDPNSNQSVNITNNTPVNQAPTLKVVEKNTNNNTNISNNTTNPDAGTVLEIKDLGNGEIRYKIAAGNGGYTYKTVKESNNNNQNKSKNK